MKGRTAAGVTRIFSEKISAELLPVAAVYLQALCPVRDQRAALDLLNPHPLEAERVRLRRRHPIRATR